MIVDWGKQSSILAHTITGVFLSLIGTTLKNPYWPTSQLFIYRNYPPTLFFPYIWTHCLRQKLQCRLVISISIMNSLPPKFKLILSRSPHTCPIHLFYTDSAQPLSDGSVQIAVPQSKNEKCVGLHYIHPSVSVIKHCIEKFGITIMVINLSIVCKVIYCTKRVKFHAEKPVSLPFSAWFCYTY